jgi:predicted AlkP superfamily pyrophosphatase or phosphodiesterase
MRIRLRAWGLAFAFTLAAACALHAPSRTNGAPAPILVLVSFDGWRNDYTDLADAPNLRALAARGVRAEALIGVFPTKTFTNHYTIVTGLYPANHGIISNNIWDDEIGERFTMSAGTSRDSRWWGGEPLWVTAIEQGHRASSMFWPGSEVAIKGVRPTEWRPFDDNFPNAERVKQVLAWLALPEPERPSFVTLYFSDVDTAGHDYGPAAPETLAAAARVDAHLGDLVRGIDSLGLTSRTTIMVVSDHGMSPLAPERRILVDDYLDMTTVTVVDWSPVMQLNPRDGTSADDVYRALHGRHHALAVYRGDNLPRRLRLVDNPRIQPVVALAADGWAITTRARFEQAQREGGLSKGDHGYDPWLPSMFGLFVAAGPDLRRGVSVEPFENVHLYELMCRLLDLEPADNDGSARVTRHLLAGGR